MEWKRTFNFPFFIAFLAIIFLFPSVSFAVDFSIVDVKIDAYLQKNGQINVVETHTYSFEGGFNGITREIVPKKDTNISEFKATENGERLKVEQENKLYKIYRKGEDENITINLSYTIENGVAVYADVAEFYWPFFDDRNESDYERMSIAIHPPKETSNVLAFGYDQAFQKEQVQADGTVLYQLGEVPAYEKGDIRVAFDAVLFPDATVVADKPMRDEIIKAEQELNTQALARAEKKDLLSKIALVIVPIFSVILLLVIVRAMVRGHIKKLDAERISQQAFFMPKERLSIPATIYFTKGQIPPEALAAALLELVRKGIVTKTEEHHFKRMRTDKQLLNHEKLLIDFLFDEIGKDGEFSFEALSEFTENKNNHQTYHSKILRWQQAVIKEVKEKDLYEKNGKLRWAFVVAGMIQLPFVVLFVIYGLYGWFFATLLLIILYFLLAIAYRTKTLDGVLIKYEWDLLKEKLPIVSAKEWETITNDEQMRAYLYGIGTNDKTIIKKNEEIYEGLKTHSHSGIQNNWESPTIPVHSMFLIGPMASSSFHTAHETTEASISSSSTTSSTGGGVDGGGGGSGAF